MLYEEVFVSNMYYHVLDPHINTLPNRYDARLLLDSLPPQSTRTQIQLPPSPSGWYILILFTYNFSPTHIF